jgi:glycosyltransferase involved in cell wall biosynthesis
MVVSEPHSSRGFRGQPADGRLQERRLRVGLIANEFFDERLGRVGGFGQAARRVAECFNHDGSLGVDVVFLSGEQRAGSGQREIRVHDTRMILADPRRRAYYARIRRERFDLLLTIDYRRNYRGMLLALPRTPALVWVRDPRTPEDVARVQTLRMPGAASGERPQGIEPVDCRSLSGVVRLSRWVGRPIILAVAAPFLAENVTSTYGLNKAAPVFLPTVVEIDPGGTPKSPRPTVVYLGRFDPIKRPWLFVEIARHFPEAEFLMMGKSNFHGPGSWQPHDLPPNVKVLGHLDDEERNRVLAASWVLVNTSIHESLSSSFLEALACESPLLSCLDPGGIVSRFGIFAGRYDGDGLDSVPQLSLGLRRLLDDHTLRAALGRSGRQWVTEVYSRSAFLAAFDDICRRLGVRP